MTEEPLSLEHFPNNLAFPVVGCFQTMCFKAFKMFCKIFKAGTSHTQLIYARIKLMIKFSIKYRTYVHCCVYLKQMYRAASRIFSVSLEDPHLFVPNYVTVGRFLDRTSLFACSKLFKMLQTCFSIFKLV